MDCGVSCPWVCEKFMYNLVSTLVPSFLIGSSSFLQARRTTIISRTSSNFGPIPPRTAELAALERQKNSHRNNGGNVVSTLAPLFFDWIFTIRADNEDNYKSLDRFEFGQDSTMD